MTNLWINTIYVFQTFQQNCIRIYKSCYICFPKTIFLKTEKIVDNNFLDEQEFEQLFKTHFQGLCYFAQRYIKDKETAREIVHDAFINLWEKRDSIDLSKSVKSYLTTSIHNRCLNYLRDNKKFDREVLTFENLSPDVAPEGLDNMISGELESKINEAIAELPEKCREVFMLNRFENLKYQEVADKLQISVKTVEAQMSKALAVLRTKLAEYLMILLIFLKLI